MLKVRAKSCFCFIKKPRRFLYLSLVRGKISNPCRVERVILVIYLSSRKGWRWTKLSCGSMKYSTPAPGKKIPFKVECFIAFKARNQFFNIEAVLPQNIPRLDEF